MKPLVKNIIFSLISIALIAIIFFGGYVSGKESKVLSVPTDLTGTLNASESADFSAFWKVWNLIDEKFAAATSTNEISDQDRIWGAVSGMVDALNDPYTQFLPPAENKEFETTISGEFSGVGMEVGIEDDLITVIAPLKNTPAEMSGIKSGDKILAIDGVSSINMSLDEGIQLIRGERGTVVTLTIAREGVSETIEINITRDTINIPTLDTELRSDGVFVISLYNFSANSASDFRDALREFISLKKDKLVIDLRGNPGGFLDASVDIASWFLPAGKIIVQEDFGNGEEKVFRSKGYNVFNDNLKIAVLVDRGSASASEILAGALKDHNKAIIVGEQSFGKGSVQELVPVTPETSFKVTIARWLTPLGNSISGNGVTPDFIVDDENTPDDVNLFEHQLNEAARLLKEM